MRLGLRTVLSLGACAAAAAAVLAHYVIDVVGDFALSHDTYDDVAHASRELGSGVALLIALFLAVRGVRICCEVAATNRYRLPQAAFSIRQRIVLFFSTIAASLAVVPAMECLDDRLAGAPITRLADVFGGSVWLGMGSTVLCAALGAWIVYAVASWLISHRDAIAEVIQAFLCRHRGAVRPRAQDLAFKLRTPWRRRTPHAFRLCKRGPPDGADFSHHSFATSTTRRFAWNSLTRAFRVRLQRSRSRSSSPSPPLRRQPRRPSAASWERLSMLATALPFPMLRYAS
ncbi:MAG: hypothetical protein ABSF08_09360 [Candidatus Cybelea sp.]